MVAENCANSRAPWPHHSIFNGPKMRGCEYDNLSLSEFIYGYLCQMEEEKFIQDQPAMIKYLRELMEDCKDRQEDWTIIRNFHGVVLTLIEKRTISWRSQREIAKMRNRYIYNLKPERTAPTAPVKSERTETPCQAYNRGDCSRSTSHNGALHICAHCFETKARHHGHPKTACYAVLGNPKRKA